MVVVGWALRLLVLAASTLRSGQPLFWSIKRLADEARSAAPRDSVIWQGLGGLCLALGLVVASWKEIVLLVEMGW